MWYLCGIIRYNGVIFKLCILFIIIMKLLVGIVWGGWGGGEVILKFDINVRGNETEEVF